MFGSDPLESKTPDGVKSNNFFFPKKNTCVKENGEGAGEGWESHQRAMLV